MTEPLPTGENDDGGRWPRTTRVLPWTVAAFMVMVFWIPFDSIQLPISLPINSDLDRFVIGVLSLVWIAVVLTRPRHIRFRSAPPNVLVYLFVLTAFLSLVFNLRQLAWDGELLLSIKELSLIVSYLAAFFVIATSIRRGEVTNFIRLLVVLACGTAIGTLIQYATGTNLFFELAKLLFVGCKVTPAAVGQAALNGPGSRPSVAGPTLHPLANATLISTGFPFALCFASSAKDRSAAVRWWIVTILLIGGCFATGRRTALAVVVVDLIILILFDPRRYGRYVLLPILAAALLLATSPHLVNSLFSTAAHASEATSTQAREADYQAVLPDVTSHLLIGRGYGSYDPYKYRILDNQMLGWLVSTGVVGALLYVLLILSVPAMAFKFAWRARRFEDLLMQGVFAASVGFLLTNFLYDTFGFRQAPYTFFLVAGLGVVWAGIPGRRSTSVDTVTAELALDS